MNLDFVGLKDYFDSERFSGQKPRKYSAIFSKIETVIDTGKIEMVYPKNLFLDDKDLEVYVVSGGKILSCILLDDKKIQLQILNLKDLKNFKCEGLYDEKGFRRITLEFGNDEVITFDSDEDTNDDWKSAFREHIKDLAKVVIKH